MTSLFLLGAVSCVQKEYDLSQPIDLKMNIGGKIEMPLLGDKSFSYSIGEVLSPADDGIIREDANGDLRFRVEPDAAFNTDYTFESISVEPYSSSAQYPESGSAVVIDINKEAVEFPLENAIFNIDCSYSDIDSQISAVREASLDAKLKFSFKVSKSGIDVALKKGFTFTLPDFVTISDSGLPSGVVKSNAHTLKLTSDASLPFSLSCNVTRFDLSSFPIKNSAIDITGDVILNGTVSLIGFDSSIAPVGTQFKVIADVAISDITPKSVSVKASPLLECTPQRFSIGNVPEILTDGSINFTLADLGFYMTATNGTPFDFKLTSDITSLDASGKALSSVCVGSGEQKVSIAAGADSKSFCLSGRGTLGGVDDSKIIVEGIQGLVSPIPSAIRIDNTKVQGSCSDFVTVEFGKSYKVGIDYYLDTPLAFTNFEIKTDYTVDINTKWTDVSFSDIAIYALVENSVPLDVTLRCDVLDANGNIDRNIDVTPIDSDGNAIEHLVVSSGSVASPTASRIGFKMSSDTPISELYSIVLHLDATSPKGETVTLNSAQKITLSNITFGTESGMSLDLNKK